MDVSPHLRSIFAGSMTGPYSLHDAAFSVGCQAPPSHSLILRQKLTVFKAVSAFLVAYFSVEESGAAGPHSLLFPAPLDVGRRQGEQP